ncbi:MAG TPA: hypothetical protein VIV84_08655 [Burkholderiaceae bacterium]
MASACRAVLLGRKMRPLEVQRVPDASHWIVHERPALVADTIARLLLRPRRTDP